MSNVITVTLLFLTVNRTGCFTIADLQPPPTKGKGSAAQAIFNYRLGVRVGLGTLI
jgi:hypothetical protein